ncbi:conserved hypothetical protein [Altererythrobacter sp. B11]|uniref:hypothetical protein n=1 Tax=Altererythrobacter sp. B11 TaxID=2060312 RepID=UPI000DC6DBD1|nr:hypothetical protein [Altererythrobacter sp. B11]BBC71503.1 conserved hypothetical protein [Altererythrobacter sp. B11]
MRALVPALLLPLLAACAAVPQGSGSTAPRRESSTGPARNLPVPPTRPAAPGGAGFIAPQIQHQPGLDGVIQQDRTALTRLFGQPRLDVTEGDMRKLQFSGEACVLDVFLYPLRPGAEPVATHVEARRGSDGLDVDRAACVQALRRGRR